MSVVAPCKAEKFVCCRRAKFDRPFRQLYQTAYSQIVQLTSTLLRIDLFSAGSTENWIIFLSNILEQKLFLKIFSGCFLPCLFCKHLTRCVGLVNSPLTMLLIISRLFLIPSGMIIIVIELMFLGVNMFFALLRAHFIPRLRLRLKWAWVGPKTYYTREHHLYCFI